ncbi:MAG TPA: hypothetical protein VHE09_08955 [Rhizomicrobium sp.]|jgi:hypothetical protein|nr:hypothetical protein [Rhizomicrobium sp.]
MTYQDNPGEDLPFRSDFTARVLAEVDAVVTRRRRIRDAGAGVLAMAAIVTVAFGISQMWPQTVSDQRVPQLVSSIDSQQTFFPPDRQFTLLNIMFPHAAAVAAFNDQYSGSLDTDAPPDDAVFFPYASSVAETDS